MDINVDPDVVLREWRTRILNSFLTVVSIAAGVMTAVSIVDAIARPSQWPAVIAFAVLEVALVLLAVFRRIDFRIRAWGVLVVPYVVGLTALASNGLGSSGRIYLIAVPIGALILIGVRAGMFASLVSFLTMIAFVVFADWGVIDNWLISDRNSLLAADWLAELSDTVILLAVIMTLLIMFYRFQERLIDSERHSQTELVKAQKLLEKQNATLEQKVDERTKELQSSNHSLEQRNAALAILNSVSEAMTQTLDPQTIMRLVGDQMREIFDVDSSMIMLLDRQTNMIQVPYEYDRAEGGYIDYVEPFPLGTGLSSRVINTAQPLMVNTLEEEIANGAYFPPEIIEKGSGSFSQSWLGVPILSSEQVLGLIALADGKPQKFNQNHVRLLQTLSSNLGTAIENARLFSESQQLLNEMEQRNRKLSIINNVQQGLVSKLDVQSMIELFGDELTRIFPPDERKANNYSVFIALYDPQTNSIEFPYLIDGEGKRFAEPPTEMGPGLTSKVIRTGQALVLKNLDEQIANGMITFTGNGVHISSQSWLGVPIKSSDQVVGVISMQDRRADLFKESDVQLLNTLASSLGVAMDNARLFSETQQRAAELATVNTVSSAIIGELEPDALIQLVGEQVRSIFNADIVYVALLDQESNIINFPYQYGQHLEPLPLGQGLTSTIIQSATPLLINEDMERQREQLGTTLIGRRARSYLGVPILAAGQAIGVISVQSITLEGVFTESDQHLLITIAANVGIALQNARLFDEVRRHEQDIRESEEKLRLIFENAFDGISVYEDIPSEGRRVLVDCNDRYCEMAGRSKDELLVTHDTRAIQQDLGVDTERFGFESIREGKAFAGVFSWIRPDGKENIIEYNAAPTKVGDRYFTIGIDRDVTERRRSQAELRHAKEMAEAATQAKSAFLANMSHELRTPLNAIIGFTRIVRRKGEGVLPEKQTGNLEKVLTSADHLLHLINTILDIAKIEAGRMDVIAANFRVAALIDLCANTAQPLLRPTVVLEKQVDQSLTHIYSDQDKIRQIVLNLLSNAAKFTHKGRITLSARPDGEYFRIAVSDTGIGISKDALPRIFKEFQQADNTTTRQYGGTGLGLSISRNLACLLGGDITVESELGKGSTFTLLLPMQYRSKSLPPADESSRIIPEPVPVPVQSVMPRPGSVSAKKRILVIDDDPDAVYILQENLHQNEFEIIGRLNGHEGLRAARELQPQAILLDIIMPGADGWQVLHDLKSDPATSNIPVILLTIVDNKPLGVQLGAAAYLLKPFDSVEVRETLHHVLGSKSPLPVQILVVDDDPNVPDMLRQSLPESDFSLESALDGDAGLRAIEAKRPDILLLDLLMPYMDGFEVIERLREDPKTQDLPIIVISAKELTAAETQRLKKTVALVMSKQGFQGERLVDEINALLNRWVNETSPTGATA
jgi:PAS domain S-box-containing protein